MLHSLSRLRGRAGVGCRRNQRTPSGESPHPALRADLPRKRERCSESAAPIQRHSASALYFFSEAFSSLSAASGSAPAFFAPSDQVFTSGSAAFFQAAVCSGVSL